MPPELATRIAMALGLDYVPSAYQIRWGPCKGVLVVNPKVTKVRLLSLHCPFALRSPKPSLSLTYPHLGLVPRVNEEVRHPQSHSAPEGNRGAPYLPSSLRPHRQLTLTRQVIRFSKCVPGHLNREFIPLFHYLGVKEDVFFELQQEAFNRINDLNSFFSKKGIALNSVPSLPSPFSISLSYSELKIMTS